MFISSHVTAPRNQTPDQPQILSGTWAQPILDPNSMEKKPQKFPDYFLCKSFDNIFCF